MVKCICQICKCGRHRCNHFMPQQVIKTNAPCEFSEYQRQYQQNDKVERGPIVKPVDVLKNEGDVDFNTTHKDKFPAHQVQQRRNNKPVLKYIKNNAHMNLETEYGTKYHPGRGEHFPLPDYHKKKTQIYGDGEDREKQSVTQKDYDPKSLGEKPVIHRMNDNVGLSDDPFDHQTTNQVDYTRFQTLPAKSVKRPDNIDTKGLPATYDTTNKDHFQKHKHQPRHQKLPPPEYQPNNKPFLGKSLMKSDYQPHNGIERSEPFKLQNNLFGSDAPLDDVTTNHDHFKGWEVQKRHVLLEKPVYTRPPGKMDFNKTSDDYKMYGGKASSRVMRPKTNIEFTGDFDGVTSYTDGYVKHDHVRDKAVQRDRGYYSSGVPFESTSESKDQFQRYNATPAKPVMRSTELIDKKAPFANDTSYGDHFQQKKLPECPSTYLVANNFSGYRIKDDFNTGHRFLIPNFTPPSERSTSRNTPPPLPPIGNEGGQQQRYVAAH